LKTFADRGGTVLLSSHLLHEIEVIADHLVVIGRGRIVADGSKTQLLNVAGTYVRGLDPVGLQAALDAAGIAHTAAPDGALSVSPSRSRSAGPQRQRVSCSSSYGPLAAPAWRRCSCS
jgi:ABC-2 type transport system ATP-binding protein